MDSFIDLANERFSCRAFSEKPVSDELIEQLIDCALAAPTAKNLQPWRLFVLKSDKALSAARASTHCHYGAPLILALGATKDEAWERPYDGRNFADVDASIVGTHIMLAAHDLGLRSVWVAHFDAPQLAQELPELAELDLVALFPIGYAADDARPAERHYQSRAKDELVITL